MSYSTNPGPSTSFETRSLGHPLAWEDGDPLVTPIVQSTTFRRSAVGSDPEHQYSRVSNPSVSALERTLGDLEHAPPAVCFSTGLAAETALFLSLLSKGDHVICGRSVYGGTTRLIEQLLRGLGIESTFVDSTSPDEITAAFREQTRLVFVETPANPTLSITDIHACSDIARSHGALLVVDNTFLTPVLQQPLDLGADISVYSTTKFIDGHSTALGGSLVSRDPALLDRFRFLRKCTGAIQSPLNAWLTANGLKTLPLRIRAQSQSAALIASWLTEQPLTKCTSHPSLLHGSERRIADAQHTGGHGAVVSFEIQGGVQAGKVFVSALKLCTLAEHVGSVETLITHPSSMTHADVAPAQRQQAGISDGLLRLSVGLEGIDELIEDLRRGFRAVKELDNSQSVHEGVLCDSSL